MPNLVNDNIDLLPITFYTTRIQQLFRIDLLLIEKSSEHVWLTPDETIHSFMSRYVPGLDFFQDALLIFGHYVDYGDSAVVLVNMSSKASCALTRSIVSMGLLLSRYRRNGDAAWTSRCPVVALFFSCHTVMCIVFTILVHFLHGVIAIGVVLSKISLLIFFHGDRP